MRTKRIVLLCTTLMFISFSTKLEATPISSLKAKEKAISFLKKKGKLITINDMRRAPSRESSSDLNSLYAFNVGQNEGYVIVSGDDDLPTILGYSDSGSINMDSLPSNMKYWLDEYEDQILHYQNYQHKKRKKANPVGSLSAYPEIQPLLTSKWNQYYPYNESCPDFFNGEKCITGCVATAMAQIMYYHRLKSTNVTTLEIPEYDCWKNWDSYGQLHVDAIPKGSFIDWDNMLDYYSNDATEIQRKAVADLMFFCGASVSMDYSPNGSASNNSRVADALKKYFDYSDNVKYMERYNVTSDDEWEKMIYTEIQNKRPVLYGGTTRRLEGHSFVCDGYDGNGYFHFNWGWGGAFDGYFLLSALNPGISQENALEYGYNLLQDAVIGAVPKVISFDDSNVRDICLSLWDTNGDGELSKREASIVKDLGDSFKNNKQITSFDELQYFTGLTYIATSTFSGCASLKSFIIPESVASIGSYAFQDCKGLTSIHIPNNIKTIGDGIINGCTSLTNVFVSNAIPIPINASTFPNRQNIVLYVPASCKEVYKNATYWNEFAEITFIIPFSDDNVKKICVSFWDKNGDLDISEKEAASVTELEKEFNHADIISFDELKYFSNLKRIGEYAFSGCLNLKTISIPNSVTSIDDYAFMNCHNLKSINLPDGLISIGNGAFQDCSSLISVTIPRSVISISGNPFSYLRDCQSIIVETGNNVYDSRNNCNAIILTASNKLISGCNNTIIPYGVTAIAPDAFAGCEKLTSIDIPEGVKSIGSGAFAICRSLKSVSIPKSATSLGIQLFWGCNSLESIVVNSGNPFFDSRNNCNAIIETASNKLMEGCGKTIIPENVKSIAAEAFGCRRNLLSIEIPNSVETIGKYAFEWCTNLAIVISAIENPFVLDPTVFSNTSNCILRVPIGKKEAYISAGWTMFSEIVEGLSCVLNIVDKDGNNTIDILSNNYENNPLKLYDSYQFISISGTTHLKQIVYERTFNNTNWQALYVPFEIPVTAEFLEHFEVAYMNNVHQYDDDDNGTIDRTIVEFFKMKSGTLKANYPYVIKAKATGTQTITVNEAMLYATEENSIDCRSTQYEYVFKGTYTRMEEDELTGCYAMSGGGWKTLSAGSHLNPFRVYLRITPRESGLAPLKSIGMRIIGEDGETTEINSQFLIDDLSSEEAPVFDLAGRRVENPTGGIYIVNGKKVVIR